MHQLMPNDLLANRVRWLKTPRREIDLGSMRDSIRPGGPRPSPGVRPSVEAHRRQVASKGLLDRPSQLLCIALGSSKTPPSPMTTHQLPGNSICLGFQNRRGGARWVSEAKISTAAGALFARVLLAFVGRMSHFDRRYSLGPEYCKPSPIPIG